MSAVPFSIHVRSSRQGNGFQRNSFLYASFITWKTIKQLLGIVLCMPLADQIIMEHIRQMTYWMSGWMKSCIRHILCEHSSMPSLLSVRQIGLCCFYYDGFSLLPNLNQCRTAYPKRIYCRYFGSLQHILPSKSIVAAGNNVVWWHSICNHLSTERKTLPEIDMHKWMTVSNTFRPVSYKKECGFEPVWGLSMWSLQVR